MSFSRVPGKVVVPIAALLAFSAASLTSKSYGQVKHEPAIFSEKQSQGTDSSLFRGWLSESWKGATREFRAKVGTVGLPGTVAAKPVSRKEYELLLAVDSQVPIYPAESCGIIIKALSKDSLSVIYPDDRALTREDAKRLASYAYLSLALVGKEIGSSFWNPESVLLLYSNAGGEKMPRKCSTGEALAGFAAFFLDQQDEMQFLRAIADGSTAPVKDAAEKFLGKGSWGRICGAQLAGSTELREIVGLIMQREDWKEQLSAYLKFMEEKFGIDAGAVKFSY